MRQPTDKEKRFMSEWFRQFGNHIDLPIEGSDRPHFAFAWFELGEASASSNAEAERVKAFNEALERAAALCDLYARHHADNYKEEGGKFIEGQSAAADECAEAIRALMNREGVKP